MRESDLLELTVLDSRLISPGFQRLTARTDPGRELSRQGYDHWLRLFLPAPGQSEVILPDGPVDEWYRRWRAMDEAVRPACRNYTVRDLRPADGHSELDIDFVLHRDRDGELTGAAAPWASSVTPGDRFSVLDQGLIFAPALAGSHVAVITDASGLPAAEAITRSLSPETRTTLIVQLADAADRRAFSARGELTVAWLDPAGEAPDLTRLPIHQLTELLDPRPDSYVYLIGGKAFIDTARRALDPLMLHEVGPQADRDQPGGPVIRVCAYWR